MKARKERVGEYTTPAIRATLVWWVSFLSLFTVLTFNESWWGALWVLLGAIFVISTTLAVMTLLVGIGREQQRASRERPAGGDGGGLS